MLAMLSEQIQKPEEERNDQFKGNKLDLINRSIAKPLILDMDMELLTLERQLKSMARLLGKDDAVVQALLQGRTCTDAAKALLSVTILTDSVALGALVDGAPASITASKDAFITAARLALPRLNAANDIARETSARDQVNRTLLGHCALPTVSSRATNTTGPRRRRTRRSTVCTIVISPIPATRNGNCPIVGSLRRKGSTFRHRWISFPPMISSAEIPAVR
jgi:hypothetical protein